jgi:hypothetical protein
MVSKKYLKDYTIEYAEKSNGRVISRAVYSGKYFKFVESLENIRKARMHFTLLVSAAWITYLFPFFFPSAATSTFYVVFPHAFVFLPLLGMSQVTFRLWTAKSQLTREQSDIISHRAPVSSLAMSILSGLALTCFIARLIADPATMQLPGDLVFGLCEAVLATASWLLFSYRNQIATCESTLI